MNSLPTESTRKFRIIFLGAGFSRPAGLPLGGELWPETLRRATRYGGRAGKFSDDLAYYRKFRLDCDGLDIPEAEVDLEEFLGFLDIEFFLRLRGSDTWSDDGNESQVLIKTLIGQILTERTPAIQDVPTAYIEFAKRLQSDDLVITFNYDILLERALARVGKPFRLFPSRYSSVGEYGATVDTSREEVIVLKVHGSVDWFDRKQYASFEAKRMKQGIETATRHPIFGIEGMHTSPITDGPRFSDDPLSDMHRLREIERWYANPPLFRATPFLLNPSATKVIYSLKDFWNGLGRAGALNRGMAIIGFSLPKHDEYARQILYQIVLNYQQFEWEEEVLGFRKEPLVVVDYRPDEESRAAFMKRYAFIDPHKATFHFDGFNEAAIPKIFGEQ